MEALLEQAKWLEEQGLIQADWTEFHRNIRRIHYRVEDVGRMYELAGKENPRDKLKRAEAEVRFWLGRLKNRDFQGYYEELLEQIKEGTMPKNLEHPLFLKGLTEAADNREETWENVFSARVFGEAKSFRGPLKNRIVTVLREWGSRMDPEMGADEVLGEFGILRYSQNLELKGDLEIEIRGAKGEERQISGRDFPLGLVLNAQTLDEGRAVGLNGIRRIVTIENKANYESMTFSRDTLYVYTHGFLSSKERRFLEGLSELKELPVLHWSDMDYGGFRIYRFMKGIFPQVRPLFMDRESYMACLAAGCGSPMPEEKRKKLENFLEPDLEPLRQCILEHGMEIEQENLLKGKVKQYV